MKAGEIYELKYKYGNGSAIRIVIINVLLEYGDTIITARKIARKEVDSPNWISEIGRAGQWNLHHPDLIEFHALHLDEMYLN